MKLLLFDYDSTQFKDSEFILYSDSIIYIVFDRRSSFSSIFLCSSECLAINLIYVGSSVLLRLDALSISLVKILRWNSPSYIVHPKDHFRYCTVIVLLVLRDLLLIKDSRILAEEL